MRSLGRLLVVACAISSAVSWSAVTSWESHVGYGDSPRLALRYSAGSRLRKEVIVASNARGRTLSGVTVFNIDCWSGEGTLIGKTNEAGKVAFIDSDAIVGITRNGVVSAARAGNRLIFKTPGVLKLHVVDGHGKPVSNKRLFLIPTSASGRLRPYGFFRGTPHYSGELATRLSGVTNRSGFVQFSNIDKRAPFDVVTDVGSKLGSLGYFGSAHAGTTCEVVISHDRSIVGRVLRFGTNTPFCGLKVLLKDTIEGHMSGYPGVVLRSTITNAAGYYQLRGLVNATFNVVLASPRVDIGMPCAVDANVNDTAWKNEEIDFSKSGDGGAEEVGVALGRQSTVCDFRLSRPGVIKIHVTASKPINPGDWTVMVDQEGNSLSNGMNLSFPVRFGRHFVYLSYRNGLDLPKRLIMVKEGETKSLTIAVPVDSKTKRPQGRASANQKP